MSIEKPRTAPESSENAENAENAVKMPNSHPEKQGLFANIADMLRKLSHSLGIGKLFGLQDGEKPTNSLQEFFAKMLGIFQWLDIERGVTIKKESDVAKIREAFRPIVDLDDTAIEFQKWDFIIYDKNLGKVLFYPAAAGGSSQHAAKPSAGVPIAEPSEKVKKEMEALWKVDTDGEIEWPKAHKWETPFSRHLGANVQAVNTGKNSCGRAVRVILENFGMKKPPRWNGNQWYGMLQEDPRFQYVEVNSLSEIPPGAILTYSGKGKINGKRNGTPMNQKYGHVEIKSASGLYVSYVESQNPGGSAKAKGFHNNFSEWKKATGFMGAFIPLATTRVVAEEKRKALKNGESAKNAISEKKDSKESNEGSEKEFINSQLNTLRKKGLKRGQQAIIVSASAQRVYLVKEDGTIVKNYPCSTAKNGLGNTPNSQKTPTGTLEIEAKIGAWMKKLTSFEAKQAKGIRKLSLEDTNNDAITSRILTLSWKDVNNANAYERNIYFHGTNEEFLLGTPASHGCIRMGNDDIIEMFELVSKWTLVQIA